MLFQAYFGDMRSVVYNFEQMGLTDVLLPFALIFTTLYAIMNYVKVFKDNNKYKVVISLAITLLVVVPHITGGYPDPAYDPINILNNMMPGLVVIIISVLLLFILLGFFYSKEVSLGEYTQGIATILALAAIFLIFANAVGWLDTIPSSLYFLEDPQLQALLLVILIFGLIVWYITREPPKTGKGFGEKLTQFIKDIGTQFSGPGGATNP